MSPETVLVQRRDVPSGIEFGAGFLARPDLGNVALCRAAIPLETAGLLAFAICDHVVITPEDKDPFDEEQHGLRLYGWVQDYLAKRGWTRVGETGYFDHPELGQHVSFGKAFEDQLIDDGLDLNDPSGDALT